MRRVRWVQSLEQAGVPLDGMAAAVRDGALSFSRMVGDLDAARAHLHEALEMFAQARDALSISMTLTSLALIANDDGHHERAARLVGAAARIRDELGGGVPPEFAGRWGAPEEDAQRSLGEDTYRRARGEGYAMSSEEAVSYALEDGARQTAIRDTPMRRRNAD